MKHYVIYLFLAPFCFTGEAYVVLHPKSFKEQSPHPSIAIFPPFVRDDSRIVSRYSSSHDIRWGGSVTTPSLFVRWAKRDNLTLPEMLELLKATLHLNTPLLNKKIAKQIFCGFNQIKGYELLPMVEQYVQAECHLKAYSFYKYQKKFRFSFIPAMIEQSNHVQITARSIEAYKDELQDLVPHDHLQRLKEKLNLFYRGSSVLDHLKNLQTKYPIKEECDANRKKRMHYFNYIRKQIREHNFVISPSMNQIYFFWVDKTFVKLVLDPNLDLPYLDFFVPEKTPFKWAVCPSDKEIAYVPEDNQTSLFLKKENEPLEIEHSFAKILPHYSSIFEVSYVTKKLLMIIFLLKGEHLVACSYYAPTRSLRLQQAKVFQNGLSLTAHADKMIVFQRHFVSTSEEELLFALHLAKIDIPAEMEYHQAFEKV